MVPNSEVVVRTKNFRDNIKAPELLDFTGRLIHGPRVILGEGFTKKYMRWWQHIPTSSVTMHLVYARQ
jgi:hypothetical protein